MRIYLTRHGETEWNLEGRLQGSLNANLTQKGIEEARMLSERLDDVDFDLILSSPLSRALDTANIIKGEKDVSIIPNQNLKEIYFGQWEGMLHKEINESHYERYNNFWTNPHLYEPLDGEAYDEFIGRIQKVIDQILDLRDKKNVLVVAHAGVVKAFYKIFKNLSLKDFWSEPLVHNTALTIINIDQDKIEFEIECDTSHIA
ncbi:histidine phosphatase family protein [Oceanirhabdus sp. W0125-5]|uniref:histidine phosphatase family protein n=1 Tax=Oceanirhabdus sp. W0125-5 TaxID=2999116 RepID=UPI0022F2B3F2|nr:histidine phosphatase family protein [Oceanirhabdus sp. W0125-5]WBW94681.1 histidine phosphatase family protein [Oceanirhabdus sp. W0125-5]